MANAIVTTGSTGQEQGQAIDNRQPYGTLSYAIALQGTFPSRNGGIPIPSPSGASEPFIGEVIQFASNFAPRGYALAQGQLLSISGNEALFSILGTIYGGDGRTTFGLPDLRGRSPIGAGNGAGLSTVNLGQSSGTETTTLTINELPLHTHAVSASSGEAQTEPTGGGQAQDNRQPTQALTPLIDGVGEVRWFAGNFAPVGYAEPTGQLLTIANNQTLFAQLGTTYGGDGTTTFALPDLRGRVVVDDGATHALGTVFGEEAVTLTEANLPAHSHGLAGSTEETGVTGSGEPYNNLQPSIALNHQLAIAGLFPSRNLQAEDGGAGGADSLSSDGSGLIVGEERWSETEAAAAVEALAEAGIARWTAAGISAEQVAQLESVTYQFGDLESGTLAAIALNNVVTIDWDASNRGWFVDATPGDDVEFGSTDPVTGELLATQVDALAGFDLLTTIMHEQGHALGLEHALEPGSVMFEALGSGGRLLPRPTDIVASSEGTVASTLEVLYDPFIAQVATFAGSEAVTGFVPTDGQLLSIGQNSAVFSLLGTVYGGNGRTDFAVPDFRDRTLLGIGQGPGLSNFTWGQTGGSATTTLTTAQLPGHSHTFPISSASASVQRPDFNGDRATDIWIRNNLVTTLRFLDATTLLGSAALGPMIEDENWQVGAIGDFDRSGIADLVWRNGATGQTVLWSLTADNSADAGAGADPLGSVQVASARALATVTDRDWSLRGAGDMDGDGDSDLLWFNSETKGVAVWYLEDGEEASRAVVSSGLTQPLVGTGLVLEGSGDFDGDDRYDLVWRDGVTGEVRLWFMDGALGRVSEVVVDGAVDAEATDLVWEVVGQGDYNYDGVSDLAWLNGSTGAVKLWLMQGAVVSEVVALG